MGSDYTNYYVLKDVETGKFLCPFPCVKDRIAIKSVIDYVNKSNGVYLLDKLRLFNIGSFDFDTGHFTSNYDMVEIDLKEVK